MRPEIVVIGGVGRKDSVQMGLAEEDDVIEAFSADWADQPLRMPVLPGRTGRSWSVPNSHSSETSRYRMAVRGVAVAYEMSGCTFPREGLGDLERDPLGGRVVSDAQRGGAVAHAAR